MITTGGFPDVSNARVLEDFNFLFNTNARTVIRLRYEDTEAGNYGSDNVVPVETRTELQLNLQGQSSDSAAQAKFGMATSGSILKAYAKYDEDIKVTDFILIDGVKFKIENLNKSNKNAISTALQTDVVFQDFDLVQVDYYNDT